MEKNIYIFYLIGLTMDDALISQKHTFNIEDDDVKDILDSYCRDYPIMTPESITNGLRTYLMDNDAAELEIMDNGKCIVLTEDEFKSLFEKHGSDLKI